MLCSYSLIPLHSYVPYEIPWLCADVATGTGLFRPLISFADDVPESARDFSKLPQVERMCALLIDPSRTAGIKVCVPEQCLII